MIRWFYFAQEVGEERVQTAIRGSNELRRLSSVVLRQRRFSLGPIKFFYGSTWVELELIWAWA